jgi:hypothetical protein
LKYFLILLLFTVAFGSLAQESETYTLNIDTRDSSVKVDVLYEKKKIRVKPGNYYYWTTANQVLRTQGGYEGRLLHGNYFCFYPAKNLKVKGTFRKGLKRGKWYAWYPNGNLSEVSKWYKGYQCGRTDIYNEQGKKILRATYWKGKLHGAYKTYSDGRLISKKKFRKGVEVILTPKPVPAKNDLQVKPDGKKSGDINQGGVGKLWSGFKGIFKKKPGADKPVAETEKPKQQQPAPKKEPKKKTPKQ